MRRVARAEMVGVAAATSAARRPVVVAAPAAVVVDPYAPAAVVVDPYAPAAAGMMVPPSGAYIPPPAVVPGPAMMAAAAPGRPVASAAAVGTAAAVVAAERRHFYLVNEATGSVLAVDRSLLQPGAHAVVERRRPDKAYHQIWYLDHENIIRSKLTDFALECRGRDERVKMAPFVGEPRQQWILEGHRIVNRVVRTDCLGLRKLLRVKEDSDVIMQLYEGKPYQHWRMEPIII